MISKNKITIIILCIVLLFISACNSSKSGSGVFKVQDIYKGSDGLTITFRQDMPSSTIDLVKGTEFDSSPPKKQFIGTTLIGAEIANKGAVKIENGYILVQVPNEFSLENDKFESTKESIKKEGKKLITFKLNGKSFELPEGEKEVFSVLATATYENLKEKQRGEISFVGCYDYKTIVGAEVCIDKNPDNKKSVKVCDVTKDISLADQGAPIAVTNIKQIANKDGEMQFLLKIKNKGDGEVAARNPLGTIVKDLCSVEPVKEEEFDKIIVTSAKIGSEQAGADILIGCQPKLVKLEKGEGKLKCSVSANTFQSTESETFTTALSVELEYAYKIKVEKSVSIESLEGYVEEEKAS